MDRVEFILRIIIRLKDEASAKLAAINTQVRALGNTAKTAQGKMDGLNSSISSMSRRLTGLQNKMESMQNTVRQIGDDADSIDNVSAAFAKAADAIDAVNAKRRVTVQTSKDNTAAAKEEAEALIDVKQRTEELISAGVRRREAAGQANLERDRQLAEIRARGKGQEPAAARPAGAALVKLDQSLVEVQQRLNEEGKRRFVVIVKATDEIIAERRSERQANAAATRWLRAQATATEENVGETEKSTKTKKKAAAAEEKAADATVEEAQEVVAEKPKKQARRKKVEEAEEKTALTAEQLARINQSILQRRMQEGDRAAREELIRRFQARQLDEQFRLDVVQAGKRFKLLDIQTGKTISTHKSYELAIKRATEIESENSDLVQQFAAANIEQIRVIKEKTEAESKAVVATEEETKQKVSAAEFARNFAVDTVKSGGKLADSGFSEEELRSIHEQAAAELAAEKSVTEAKKEQADAIKKETVATEQIGEITAIELEDHKNLREAHHDYINKLKEAGELIVKTKLEADDARQILQVTSQLGFVRTTQRVAGAGRTPGPVGEPVLSRFLPPIAGGSEFFGPGSEAEFEKQQKKVVILRAEFERYQDGLRELRREFVRGKLDEQDFFAEFEKFIKLLQGAAKRAPVDFGETIGREIRKVVDKTKLEMEKLNQVRVDNSHLRSFAAAMALVEKGAINLNDKIELTKGAVQILRKEGDQLKASGLGNLVDKLTASERLLIFFETELESRRASGRGTKTLERDMGRLQSRILATKEALRQLLVESEREVEKVGVSTDVDVDPGDEESAIAKFNRFKRVLQDLNDEFREPGSKLDRKVYVQDLKDIATEVNKLVRGQPVGTPQRRQFQQLANEAKETADAILEAQRKAASDRAQLSEEVRRKRLAEERATTAEERSIASAARREAERELRASEARNRRALADDLKERQRISDEKARIAQREVDIPVLQERFATARKQFGGREIGAVRAISEFTELASRFKALAKDVGDTDDRVHEFRDTAVLAARAVSEATERARKETEEVGNAFTRLTRRIGDSDKKIRNLGDSVASLDNRLRGLAVLAIFVFAQQLISALVGVAGGLTAVAASAVQAGFALGGVFVAGITQAIPALGLFAAALAQVKAVSDAVNQAQTVREQAFHRSQQSDEQAAQRADQLSTAQDSLRDAERGVIESHRRVAEAQRGLTEARKEARRNLLELIDSEKDAELAARGAALSQEEAQERLSAALLGGSNLDLRQAEQGVFEAARGRTTADRRVTEVRREVRQARGIDQTDAVRNAERALRAARAAEDDAERSVRRTQRSFEQVGRNANKLTDDTFAAQSQLLFLLKQLSPAQLRLFVALTKIRDTYKQTFTPITDILVDAFTRGVDSADKILRNPRFLRTARDLAGAMADSLDTLREAVIDPENFDQILRIVENGAENLPAVTDIVVKFGEAWLNVAEFSEPAVDKILGWVDDLAGDIKKLTDNKDEMESFFSSAGDHAVAWAELAKSAVLLFAAIAGAGGSDTGLTIVEDLTRAIQKATEWVRDHREEVAGFFEDSRRVINEIALVVLALGEAFVAVFDPETVEELGEFLRESVIPALELVVKGVGAIVQAFLTLINEVPFGNEIGKWIIAMTLFVTLITSAVGAFSFLALNFLHFFSILSKISGGFTLLRGGIARVVEQLALLIGKRVGLGLLFTGLAGIASKIRGPARGAAAAGSIAETLTSLSARPGTQRVPRGGILGKLGFSKTIAAEGADALKSADDVGKKAGSKFGSSFLGPGGMAGFLKFSAWTTVGVAAVTGIFSGIKQGDIGAGVQDFMHSLSFGIIKSSAEVAEKTINEEIMPLLKKTAEEGGKQLSTALATPVAPLPQDAASIGQRRFPGMAPDLRTDLQRRFEALPKPLQDAILKLEELQTKLRKGTRNREVNSFFENLRTDAEKLKDKFPQLTDAITKFEQDTVDSMEHVQEVLKPQAISFEFAFDISKTPKKWKEIVDAALVEADKLAPGLRGKAKDSIDAMVDQMEKQGDLPPKAADKIRQRVERRWEVLTDHSRKETAKTARAVARNLSAAGIAVEAQLGLMGINVNKILKAFGVGEVKIQNIKPRDVGQAAGALFSFLGAGGARGGIAGMMPFAGGGMLGNVGERGRDLIPALLGRGEMVFNQFHQKYLEPAVQHFYGHNLVDVFRRIKGQHAGPSSDWPYAFAGGYAGRSPSGNQTVAIPERYTSGTPEFIAAKVLRSAISLMRRFNMIATDAFATSGHKGAGHLTYGTALDAVPKPGGSWDTVDAAVAWARSKGLTVLYDGVAGHGRGHHAHFELEPGKVFADIASQIRRQIFRWPVEGPLRDVGQAMLDKVRKAANRFLSKETEVSSTHDPGHAPEGALSASTASRIFRSAFRLALPYQGFDRMQSGWLSNLLSLAGEESSLRTDAQNLTPAGLAAGTPQGILQVTKSTFAAYHLPGFDDPFNPLHNAIASIRYQLSRYRTIVAHAPYSFGGIAGSFAQGGEVSGPTGAARNIIAHAGEWVVNQPQQGQLASMLGTSISALRSMLGFHGGPRSFQGGGEVAKQESALNLQFTTAFEKDRIRDIIQGIYRLPTIPVRAWSDLVREANRALRAIDAIGQNYRQRIRSISRQIQQLRRGGVEPDERDDIERLRERRERVRTERGLSRDLRRAGTRGGLSLKEFIKDINELTKDSGLLDQMDAARERFSTRLSNDLTKLTFNLVKFEKGGKARFRVEKVATDIEIADKALDNTRRELNRIVGERGVIKDALQGVNARLRKLRRGGVTKDEAGDVRALVQQQNELRDRLIQNASDKQAAIQAVFEAQVERQQTIVDDINKRADTATATNAIGQRLASLFGNTGTLAGLMDGQIGIMQGQMEELRGRLDAAKQIGNTPLVESLNAQIAELDTSIQELATQKIQTLIDAINTTASRGLGRLDLLGRMADAMGAVGLAGAATLGGQTLSRGQLFTQRGQVLGDQRTQLQQQLEAVKSNALTAQNNTLIDSLNDQILELTVQIAENNKAAFQAKIEDVNTRTSFQLNLLQLRQRVVELTGQISKTDTTGQVRDLLVQRTAILEKQGAALNGLLREATRRRDQEAINDLTTQLLENQIATLENTIAINQLTNQSNLQEFTSTAWQLFRTAIFDGLGNLLPRYAIAIPSAQMGAHITRGGIIRVHPGEDIIPAKVARGGMNGAGGDVFKTDVNVTSPTEVADPVYLGNAIGWRIANNPNIRP